MIWRHEEGGRLRYGLNWSRDRHTLIELMLHWRGWRYAYRMGLRVRPRAAASVLGSVLVWRPLRRGVIRAAGGTCPGCGFYNHPDANVRDAGDTLVYCANCHHTWSAPC